MSLVNVDNLKNILSNTKDRLINNYNIDKIIIPISLEEYTNLTNTSSVDYTKFYLVYSDEDINNAKKAMLYHNNTLYDITNSDEAYNSNGVQQKVSLNVTSTEPIQIYTNDINNKLVIDNYKFVEGENDVTSILKEFNNGKKSSFFYNNEEINFDDNGINIKNEYKLTDTLNSDGLYESEDIDGFIEINEVKLNG